MITLLEAQAMSMAQVSSPVVEKINVLGAIGRCLAADVMAPSSVPGFRTSAVDGWAVHSADCPGTLTALGTVAAGGSPIEASQPGGQTVKVMTGAPMPEGFDAMVMVENAVVTGAAVSIAGSVTAGQYIRDAGSSIDYGEVLAKAGEPLQQMNLVALVAAGISSVEVFKAPVIGLISTGDELVEPGQSLRGSQIVDINRLILTAVISQLGLSVVDYGICNDTYAGLNSLVKTASRECDVIITTGGVSMGDYDFVKALAQDETKLQAVQIAMKPGKPAVIGSMGDAAFYGLPGNPVSTRVSFELLVRPALKKLLGYCDLSPQFLTAQARFDRKPNPDGKTHYLRARYSIDGSGHFVEPLAQQGSHQVLGLVVANCLVPVPSGEPISIGDSLQVILI